MMNTIPVVLGATGTGKTVISDLLCKKINGEIISADSRQIYKYLNIGTNKSFTKTTQHLIDIINPDEIFSAGDFFDAGSTKLHEIKHRNKIPLIVGGTGLYIKALLEGGLAKLPAADWSLRNKLSSYTSDELYQKLLEADPVSAQKNKNNPHRLTRSLEVYYLTGTPMSVWHIKSNKCSPPLKGWVSEANNEANEEKFICIGLYQDKKTLYEKIRTRAKWMVENGIIEETQKVLNMGYPRSSPAFKSIGYRYVFDLIDGKIAKQELIERIFIDTKKYIKRQLTWFKKYPPEIEWIDITFLSESAVIEKICEKIWKK